LPVHQRRKGAAQELAINGRWRRTTFRLNFFGSLVENTADGGVWLVHLAFSAPAHIGCLMASQLSEIRVRQCVDADAQAPCDNALSTRCSQRSDKFAADGRLLYGARGTSIRDFAETALLLRAAWYGPTEENCRFSQRED
jgi:hypothetical protein